ncbi:hypothetical protein [Acidipropionibacterium jensenii]|uniref:hypothetical protein n=1 Tax=Acidipropionibacterium jensenii TaxID=1749 RepID=UPI0015868A67|nr:hypothetical protein [Acidipropionibacterium jensenii]
MSTTDPAKLDPVALMSSFVLEDGRRWGEAAEPWQLDDAREVLAPTGPRRSFRLAGRGMSKTGDTAAEVLALMLTEAPAHSRSYVFAVDADQAAIFADSAAGWIDRTPGLAGAFTVDARTITARASGATLRIETSDGASAFGLRPYITVADELPMWPATTNHRKLWSAIASGVAKVPGARLIVTGTGGSPAGLGAEIWKLASDNPAHWRTTVRPGPSPWWTADEVAATQASLTASEWRRLILCEFAEGDDSLTDPAAVAAAIRPGSPVLPYSPGRRYIITLDIGTRRDLTAVAVSHTERTDAGRVVVVDRVMSWRPSKQSGGRVDLDEVQHTIARLAREYHAPVHFDRMQAEQLTSNLTRAGVVCHEYVFSSAGANRLARALYIALRDRALSLPDDPELVDGFNSTRMIETTPGTVKLHNPAGHHDDIPTVVGMAVALLTERPDSGTSAARVPTTRNRPDLDRRPTRVVLAATRHHRAGPDPADAHTALQGLAGRPVVHHRRNPFERGHNR